MSHYHHRRVRARERRDPYLNDVRAAAGVREGRGSRIEVT